MGVGIGCLGMIIFGIILFSVASSGELSAGFVWLCLIGIAGSAFGGLFLDNKRKLGFGGELSKKLKDTVKKIDGFNVTQEFMSPNFESYIAIDEDNKKICIIENEHKNFGEISKTLNRYLYQHNVFSYADIIQSEVIKDGVTINRTSRGSQIGGAIIGGALAGGVGAIIGGLGASSESKSIITSLELQIVVNNSKKSNYKVVFKSPNDLGAFTTGNEINDINHWHNLLSHIINRTDNNSSISSNKPLLTISDELKKLAELKDSGILTEKEFNTQKQKLLSQ
ncbi:MAG TPA: SHOCT domain-containing protein [Bacillales bacterium]|nr:SHOCT domain-containing protein [Bacillales bacterium]